MRANTLRTADTPLFSIKAYSMKAEINNTLTVQEILVNEIVFYSREEVSLFGFLHSGGKYHETEFIIARNTLQTLLSKSGQTGIEILWRIEQLFLHPHEVPAVINLIDVFGTTQELTAPEITLDVPVYENETGELQPKQTWELLFVEQVTGGAEVRMDSLTR